MSDKEPRTSYIEKRIEVKADLGEYSNVTVSVGFGENIEWTTTDERRKKLKALTKELSVELQRDLDTFLKANGLRKRCSILTNAPLRKAFDGEL
jgi:hypothetical protein